MFYGRTDEREFFKEYQVRLSVACDLAIGGMTWIVPRSGLDAGMKCGSR